VDTLLGNYGWILVLLIFLAPLVALWWAARRVRRWWRDRAKSKAVAELAAPEVQSETGSEAPAGGYSFPLGVPLVVYPLLLLAIRSKSGTGWAIAAHITYFLLLGLFLWEALNRKEYEKIRANDPSLNRITWLLNWLLFFVALPLVAWLFFGLPTLVR
jgi:hypothetical protein